MPVGEKCCVDAIDGLESRGYDGGGVRCWMQGANGEVDQVC